MTSGKSSSVVPALWVRAFASLNEAQRRWFAAERALALGRGGIRRIEEATGLSRKTILRGIQELRSRKSLQATERIRSPGGGRKRLDVAAPEVLRALEGLVAETTAGDPMSALRWTVKSSRTLAKELKKKGHEVSHATIGRMLNDLDYTLQGNAKTDERGDHPRRDEQFRGINRRVKEFRAAGDPVISVDTKKKERVGNFKNGGRSWRPKGKPHEVLVHDFPNLGIGPAIPYGTYDLARNQGMVNVGMTHDTPSFAVESLRQWWRRFGRRHYPDAKRLLICADGGGSNASRSRAWKYHLQDLANETGVPITVAHYPPGTSKWNKIEHRMFSFISMNWRGQPLSSYETVVNLISGTRTASGLQVAARLDREEYPLGEKISNDAMGKLNLERNRKLPDWNYTLSPRVSACTD